MVCLPISNYERRANLNADAEHQATVTMAVSATGKCMYLPRYCACTNVSSGARYSQAVKYGAGIRSYLASETCLAFDAAQ